MKKLVVMLGLMLTLAFQAQATYINLGVTPGQPSDIQSELNRLVGQVDLWNGNVNNAGQSIYPLPDPTDWHGTQFDGEFSPTFQADLTGFTGYLVLKFGDWDQFYYLDDITTVEIGPVFTSTVSNGSGTDNLGLSHYTTFTQSVPDGGSTLALMGFGVMLLGAAKRKFVG
jgi:hypothetical protein